MDKNSSSLIRRPEAAEITLAHSALQERSYHLLCLVCAMLRHPQCARKLPCFRPLCSPQRSFERRYREAFAICWRIMCTAERRLARTEICWHLHCEAEYESELHRAWCELECDPQTDRTFQQQYMRRPWEMFRDYVATARDLNPASFAALWQRLSWTTQGALLACWWRLLHCGCHEIKPCHEIGRTWYRIRLTEEGKLLYI